MLFMCVYAWVQMCVWAVTHLCVLIGVHMYVHACGSQRLTSSALPPVYLWRQDISLGLGPYHFGVQLAGRSVSPRDLSVLVMRLQCGPLMHLFDSCARMELQSSWLHSAHCADWAISSVSQPFSGRFFVLTINCLSNLFSRLYLDLCLPSILCSNASFRVIFSTSPKLNQAPPFWDLLFFPPLGHCLC